MNEREQQLPEFWLILILTVAGEEDTLFYFVLHGIIVYALSMTTHF